MSHTMLSPPKMSVPATPAMQDVDINTLYNMANARLLGKGGFSEVIAAQHLPTGEMRALKVMQRAALRGKKAEMVAHEKEILRRTCHPNVVSLYETIQNSDLVYFSLDLMDEDLFEFVVRHKSVNESLTRVIMFQLLSAIKYLHEQSIVHRDIKPENILINVHPRRDGDASASVSPPSPPPTAVAPAVDAPAAVSDERARVSVNEMDCAQLDVVVKLADFGLAKLVLEWDVNSTPCGTSFYIAPEVIRGIEAQGAKPLCTNKHLVKSVDVWSAGVVFYLLLCGRPPFRGRVKTTEERRALLSNIDHGLLFRAEHGWDAISDAAKDLIVRMLEQDSSKRITATDALRHAFFAQHGLTQPVAGGDLMQRMREQTQRAREYQQLHAQQQTQQAQCSTAAAVAQDVEEHPEAVCYYSSGAASIPPPPPPPPLPPTTMMAASPAMHGGTGNNHNRSNGGGGGNGHHAHHQHYSSNNGTASSGQASAPVRRSLLANVAHFFGSSKGGKDGDGGAPTAQGRVSAEEQQQLRTAIAELQQGVIRCDDVEGDETSYSTTVPYKTAPPARPAVMNNKIRPGPAALKR